MKSNNSKLYIKKQLRDNGISHQRITNSQGKRVWMIGGKEYATLAEYAASSKK
ncbi:MAG: hypothetical protein WC428_06735 [Candidatus Paceibacterota bacterium]